MVIMAICLPLTVGLAAGRDSYKPFEPEPINAFHATYLPCYCPVFVNAGLASYTWLDHGSTMS